jgi:manganese transport protein
MHDVAKPLEASVISAGWRRARGEPSLREVWGSIPVTGTGWRRLLAFLGPGYLVSVGYMDPGNWATSLAGGSKFGYALLSIALLSNLMAILLQALCARLGFATGRDLAQACRDAYSKPASYVLWVLAEIAICATDVAEVIGTAIGLNLLFGIPLELGVFITALDVILILYLQNLGFRWIEAFVVGTLLVIAACFGIEVAMAQPDMREVILGFAPTVEIVRNPDMLYLAMGILGATVMPHNLYLHSSIVQTRVVADTIPAKREAIKFATIDSTVALMFALFINGAILVLAAAVFHHSGHQEVAEIQDAYHLLDGLLGVTFAGILFAVALLASGQNSTLTGTLAGQIVMEGFLNIRLRPGLRRLITRAIAIVPAVVVIGVFGEGQSTALLVASQVCLSMQLGFACWPLMRFTGERAKMGEFVNPWWVKLLGWTVTLLIIALNVKLLLDIVGVTGGSS